MQGFRTLHWKAVSPLPEYRSANRLSCPGRSPGLFVIPRWGLEVGPGVVGSPRRCRCPRSRRFPTIASSCATTRGRNWRGWQAADWPLQPIAGEQAGQVPREPVAGPPPRHLGPARPERPDEVAKRPVDVLGNPRPDPLEEQHEHPSGHREQDGHAEGQPLPAGLATQDRRDRDHGKGQERDQEPGTGRPAPRPFGIAEVHQKDGRDDGQRDARQLDVPPQRRGPAIREEPGAGWEHRREGRDARPRAGGRSGWGRGCGGQAGSGGYALWRTARWRDGSNPCPRGSRTPGGCNRAMPGLARLRRSRSKQGHRPGAGLPGTGSEGRAPGSPRPAPPEAR